MSTQGGRRRRHGHALVGVVLVCCGLAAWPSPARAQRGLDIRTFTPSVDSLGFLAVDRARTLPAWSFEAKLTADFADRPLAAVMLDPASGQRRRQSLIDWQVVTHVGLALGLLPWLEAVVDVAGSAQGYSAAYGHPLDFGDPMPTATGFYLANHSHTIVQPPNASANDFRLGLKARLVGTRGFGLGLLAVMTVPSGDDSAFLGESTVTFRPTLIADFAHGRWSLGLNAGAVIRQAVSVGDPNASAIGSAAPVPVVLALGHELTWSAALGFRALSWLTLSVEVLGLQPLTGTAPQSNERTLDLLGALRFVAGPHLSLFVGGGAGLFAAASRRDLGRAVAGLCWSPSFGGEPKPAPSPIEREAPVPPPPPPDRDRDGDHIPDRLDHCPDEPEDVDGFADEDGCPDLDNDGDGIADAQDRCPDEPETRNGVDDEDGCPDTASPMLGREWVLPDVYFAPGKTTFDATALAVLHRVADRILAAPPRRLRIEGHADRREVGHAEALALSTARALAVRTFLLGRGIDPERLQAVGYGASRPRTAEGSTADHGQNRRVEFIVVDQ